ncbi:glucosaminidase domain-containing protein [Thalassotalea sp. ND16A]|uniref:glucosaminidase domain-containing protein n=1 Tax=Thalassotalea sp. ND16A TaxID=1535422 RepID=UPI00068BA0F2|nr:glucosaminidase domain-containing protein [Thalassotalea sp. ND16A]
MALSSNKAKIIIAAIFLIIVASIGYYVMQREAELPPMTVQEKKARFKSLIVPAVESVYLELMQQYQDIKTIIDAGESNDEVEQLKVEYKVSTDAQLLMALKPHPKSIAIAQAAMESSWATSRFFRKGYNIFGVWSFDEDEPRIAALQKRGDKTIWVKKYDSIEEAVYDYYRTLARSDAFAEFRQTKMETSDPFILVTKLDKYSEKGSLYGEELTSIIKYNKFDNYDR